MADASKVAPASPVSVTLAATALAGELRQLASGRAAWFDSVTSASSGNLKAYQDVGQIAITKTTGMVFLDGGRVYWDRSARAAHYKPVDDQDFYVGVCVGDAGLNDTSCTVNLNVQQVNKIDLVRDPFITAPVGTRALGGLGIERHGGALNFVLSSTSEAQKLDALSKDGFSTAANAIVEIAFNVVNDGAGSAVDVSLGVASATHATDADAIAKHLLVHLDANATAIKLQSKDGTTTVTATDTTKVYVEGAGNANRKEVWFDMRNPADVQAYVDAVNVLPATIFDVSASTSVWYALAHIEKTSAADVYEIDVERFTVRTAEQ